MSTSVVMLPGIHSLRKLRKPSTTIDRDPRSRLTYNIKKWTEKSVNKYSEL